MLLEKWCCRFVQCRIAANLHFVKNIVSCKVNKAQSAIKWDACIWRWPREGDCSVCMYSHQWLTNQHETFHPMPGFSGFKAVASIGTALYQLRCSLGFYFPFHTSPYPPNPESWFLFRFVLPGDFTVGNLKSLPWLYLYSCPLPRVTSLM